jgi:hypothetical protein
MKIKIRKKSETVSIEERGISQSLLETYRQCPVKARLRLQGFYRPTSSKAMIFGSILHEGLESIYNEIRNHNVYNPTKAKDFCNDTGVKMFKKVFAEFETQTTDVIEEVESAAARVLIILPLYFQYWKTDFNVTWMKPEKWFRVKVGKMLFRGRRDGELFKQGATELWLFETKSKSQFNSDTIMKILLNQLQVILYLWTLFSDYNKRPNGVIYNIIRNPLLKKLKRKSWAEYRSDLELDIGSRPDFYFVRIERKVTFERVEQYIAKLSLEMDRFLEWVKGDPIFDMPNGGSCEGKYGCCEFLDCCASGLKDFSMLERRDTIFPELKE